MRDVTLRVVCYNIKEGGGFRMRDIARVLRRERADVIALLEVTHRWPVEALARTLGMQMVFGRANNAFHVAWLSRLPVVRHANHRHPGLAKTMLEIEVLWAGESLQLFATHLAAGSDTLHPAHEALVIIETLRAVARGPHLLAGDFNALHPADVIGTPPPEFIAMQHSIDDDPRQAIRSILGAGYLDCYRTLHPDAPGYTFPTATPWLRLDYIFGTEEMTARLAACEVVMTSDTLRASDHFPLSAEFGF